MKELLIIAQLASQLLEAYNVREKRKYAKKLYEIDKILQSELARGYEEWDKNVIDRARFDLMLLSRSLLVDLREEKLGSL